MCCRRTSKTELERWSVLCRRLCICEHALSPLCDIHLRHFSLNDFISLPVDQDDEDEDDDNVAEDEEEDDE